VFVALALAALLRARRHAEAWAEDLRHPGRWPAASGGWPAWPSWRPRCGCCRAGGAATRPAGCNGPG
jgi:hypothetical protein